MFNMNVNFKFLLLGTSLSLIPNLTYAQCAVTDCLQLGYTSLKSCGGGLKCPFGEYWACPKVTKAELGSCNGYAKNCKIGDILNSDGTCTGDKINGKTPIGIVLYISGGRCGWAMTVSPVAQGIAWGDYNSSVPGVSDYTDSETAFTDYNACGNTEKIIQASKGDSSKYPAAYAAVNYAPASVPETKGKWCLPAIGMLHDLYANLETINNTRTKLGVSEIYRGHDIWSSAECSVNQAWYFANVYYITDGVQGGVACASKYTNRDNYVYPVIMF